MTYDFERLFAHEQQLRTVQPFDSPDEFLHALLSTGGPKQGLIDKNRLIFRGQADARWPLVSRLGRKARSLPSGSNKKHTKYTLGQLEGVYTEHFIRHASMFEGSLPDSDDRIAWLTLMQHHGAPTRLLDWTWSPFVALFMALGFDSPPDAEKAALFVLDYKAIALYWNVELPDMRGPCIWGTDRIRAEFPYRLAQEKEGSIVEKAIKDQNEYLPIPIRPRHTIQRYQSQQAVLTVTITDEGDVPEPLELGPRDVEHLRKDFEPLLQKVSFPLTWRNDLLRSLTGMGLSHSSMFPTLDGLGQETAHLRSVHPQL